MTYETRIEVIPSPFSFRVSRNNVLPVRFAFSLLLLRLVAHLKFISLCYTRSLPFISFSLQTLSTLPEFGSWWRAYSINYVTAIFFMVLGTLLPWAFGIETLAHGLSRGRKRNDIHFYNVTIIMCARDFHNERQTESNYEDVNGSLLFKL